jgi:hypothetical protein
MTVPTTAETNAHPAIAPRWLEATETPVESVTCSPRKARSAAAARATPKKVAESEAR